MKVEVMKTLKGKSVWEKGRIFDSDKEPIPPDILTEVENKTPMVRVLAGAEEIKEMRRKVILKRK